MALRSTRSRREALRGPVRLTALQDRLASWLQQYRDLDAEEPDVVLDESLGLGEPQGDGPRESGRLHR